MTVQLTEGAIEALTKGLEVNNPQLQVVNIRRIDAASGPVRFRLMMSDGLHINSSFMMATQLNGLYEDHSLLPNCVCLLKRSVTNVLKDGRRVIVVLDMEVVKSAKEVGAKIGTPTPYVEGQSMTPQNQFPVRSLSSAGTPPSHSRPSDEVLPQASRPQSEGEHAEHHTTNQTGQSMTPQNQFPGRSLSSAGTPPSHSRPSAASSSTRSPPMTPRGSPAKVVPIAYLNPYRTKWTIRVRVTKKSSIRTWTNSRGEGRLFSFDALDHSDEIRVTVFNKEVDKFFSLLETGKVYFISRGTLKLANKQYTSLRNDYEMSLHSQSTIVPCEDPSLPMVHCDFVPIAQLEHKNKDSVIDVIGVCRSVEDVAHVTTKASRELLKRTIHLIDSSANVVTLTLWGEEAESFDGSCQPVVVVKGARVSDFGGRSLSTVFSSTVMVNPDIPEAHQLRGWFDKEGYALAGKSLTEFRPGAGGANTCWKTLRDVTTEQLGHGDKAEYYSCVATILFCRQNCLYKACPTPDCKKKVMDNLNGLFRCEKCNKEFPNYKHCLMLSANIADFGDNQWVTCFQETAEKILGHDSETLGQLKEKNEDAFDEVFQKANFTTHIFRNRVKLETYNDEIRLKTTVMEVKMVDHRDYSRRLISNIRKIAY
ncbi:hypothetical protein UPYG_G00127700 [Umbra pygmaea]|uniref:Replication protein A subunit n=1 Tax=Umbra pygmaea TaxID=75934 RepID=A0ABD0X779_UMBPY